MSQITPGELAWARRFPDIFKRVLWDFWCGPCVHTTSGLKPLITEYRWPLSPFVLPVNELGPNLYDFQASDPTIFPQPLQPTSGIAHSCLPRMMAQFLATPLIAWRWMNLLKPYHPIPSHLNPESLQTLLSQLDSQDAGVWIKVRLLGLELQGLSRMFMGRAVVLLSLYNWVLPPVWPTMSLSWGHSWSTLVRSELQTLWRSWNHQGHLSWAVEFLESYFSHDRVKFSEKDSKSRDNPRRSAVLRHVAQERQGYDTVYDAISRLYIPDPCRTLRLWHKPILGWSGTRSIVRLANLLRLPKAWGGRHSVLSLMRVGDDRVLTPPSWCTTVPRSLQKACVSHLAEADAFLYFADVFQCTPPPRPVSPSAPPGYRPPPVSLTQIQVPQPQPPLPKSPIIVDPPSTVIEVDLDKATTALASAAPHDTPGSAAHPSSITPDSDLHLISATFPQDPIPTSTWYFVGVGPIGTKESPVQAQAQAVVRGYEEGTLQGGFPGIRSAWITASESIDKYYAHVDLEYYSLVLAPAGLALKWLSFSIAPHCLTTLQGLIQALFRSARKT
ncbi:hypothetical protein BS47DRAFT_1369379 [Hydnum rufescens UP504]|uniref:Uncharacterized protein n=1 Tax=Hydnum rufescens UP504 TaxID=1448309 RepID=A0A9P6DMK6_9AGAM|nr:hypothetical protein BS47DRAFT_1369379 [Hydnum rufescens UP504]